MSSGEWRPEVGERVAIYGEILSLPKKPNGRFAVVKSERMEFIIWPDDLHPLPAPTAREPWEVLREAADIMAANSWLNAPEQLRRQADRLEAAARPAPPPTLAEAVRAYVDAVEEDVSVDMDIVNAMKAALARAEAGQ